MCLKLPTLNTQFVNGGATLQAVKGAKTTYDNANQCA